MPIGIAHICDIYDKHIGPSSYGTQPNISYDKSPQIIPFYIYHAWNRLPMEEMKSRLCGHHWKLKQVIGITVVLVGRASIIFVWHAKTILRRKSNF